MKKTKKENQPDAAKKSIDADNNTRSDKSRQDKQQDDKKGAEIFKKGTEPKGYENQDITGPDDYRLRATRSESGAERRQGNKPKAGQPTANRNKIESVKAEMRNRSRGSNVRGKANTKMGRENDEKETSSRPALDWRNQHEGTRLTRNKKQRK